MTDIYVVRHGQTAWNKEEIFRGRTDVPLNEMGLKEASLAAEFFRGGRFRPSTPALCHGHGRQPGRTRRRFGARLCFSTGLTT